MRAKEFIPASKPRNFVAKNQKTAGAGAHKDKKKAAKQGDVKHKKKEYAMESSLEEYGDTAKGQKMLAKVQKRAVDRVVSKKADTDPAYAKKNKDTADRAWERMKDMEEGRHGYDDAGFSLAPGHDEGEPVYNPRYDRTGQYDRKAKYSQDYDYNTGKPLGGPEPAKKGFIFYNVADPQTAQKLGLKQTKSGKWYLPTGSTFLQKQADKVFGKGKIWYPKD